VAAISLISYVKAEELGLQNSLEPYTAWLYKRWRGGGVVIASIHHKQSFHFDTQETGFGTAAFEDRMTTILILAVILDSP
jgi:hypothetical protein